MKLSLMQHGLLKHLSDGAKCNLFAWPLIGVAEAEDRPVESLKVMWAAAMLHVRGMVEIVEEDEESAWLSITPAGRAALEGADD